MDIIKKYGTCLIPKGTILFSAILESDKYEYIFFGLKCYIARAFKKGNRKIVAFKFKRDLELLFMLKEITRSNKYISSGDEIFKTYFPDCPPDIDDLDIKQNKHLLKKMISILQNQNINGWLTSLENNPELEIFILGNQIYSGLFTIIERAGLEEEFAYYDALKYIQLNPANEFIIRSKNNFGDTFETRYKQDVQLIKRLINDDGYTKERAVFDIFNLRHKLKI